MGRPLPLGGLCVRDLGEGDPQHQLGQAHSMVLGLTHGEGPVIFDRLVETAHVMVADFPLKVRARLRMRYADVAPAAGRRRGLIVEPDAHWRHASARSCP